MCNSWIFLDFILSFSFTNECTVNLVNSVSVHPRLKIHTLLHAQWFPLIQTDLSVGWALQKQKVIKYSNICTNKCKYRWRWWHCRSWTAGWQAFIVWCREVQIWYLKAVYGWPYIMYTCRALPVLWMWWLEGKCSIFWSDKFSHSTATTKLLWLCHGSGN